MNASHKVRLASLLALMAVSSTAAGVEYKCKGADGKWAKSACRAQDLPAPHIRPAAPTTPSVGMSRDDASTLPFPWGKPGKVNKTKDGAGEHEQWVYADVQRRGFQYLYFDNGVLTSMHE